jgi:hypothetical protein
MKKILKEPAARLGISRQPYPHSGFTRSATGFSLCEVKIQGLGLLIRQGRDIGFCHTSTGAIFKSHRKSNGAERTCTLERVTTCLGVLLTFAFSSPIFATLVKGPWGWR